jgi:hypothetical protein
MAPGDTDNLHSFNALGESLLPEAAVGEAYGKQTAGKPAGRNRLAKVNM